MKVAGRLTLEELAVEVEKRLAKLGLIREQADGRVAAAPDARTVRYYGTLGLLDRPEIVDRAARYGERHVVQLVAIKALQTQDMTLAAIQKNLYGKSTSELSAFLSMLAGKPRSPAIRTVLWREVTIEPGLKLMVEGDWSPGLSPAALEERIKAALAALKEQRDDAAGRLHQAHDRGRDAEERARHPLGQG